MAGADAWFSDPESQVSAHYGVSLVGDYHRYVSRYNTAWANGVLESGNVWPIPSVNPNWLSISIETEDDGDSAEPVTDEQYAMVRSLARTVMATYPTIEWLMGHDAISPRSRPNCPGPRWREYRLPMLAGDCGLRLL